MAYVLTLDLTYYYVGVTVFAAVSAVACQHAYLLLLQPDYRPNAVAFPADEQPLSHLFIMLVAATR